MAESAGGTREYVFQCQVRYSGRETATIRIKAEDQKEAESKLDDCNIEDHLNFYNIEIDSFDSVLISQPDPPEGAEPATPRCPHTVDML